METGSPKSGLHPMVWVATIAVTAFSAVGIASLTGLLPRHAEEKPVEPAVVATAPGSNAGTHCPGTRGRAHTGRGPQTRTETGGREAEAQACAGRGTASQHAAQRCASTACRLQHGTAGMPHLRHD